MSLTHPFQRSISHAIDALAGILYREARFESVEGKEAIAATVMNQVRLTGSHAVETPRQTACRTWDKPTLATCPTLAICQRIAARAVNGTLKDPTHGATVYHAKSVHPGWAWHRAPLAEIGNYLFYGEGVGAGVASAQCPGRQWPQSCRINVSISAAETGLETIIEAPSRWSASHVCSVLPAARTSTGVWA